MLRSNEEHVDVVRRSLGQNLLPASSYHSTKYGFSIAILLESHFLLLISTFVKMSWIVGTGKHLMVTFCQLCHNWRMELAFYLAYPASYGRMLLHSEID